MRPAKASIVLTAHQEGRNVRSTIEAIAVSTDVDYEIILVDDDSSDGSCDFALACDDRRIRLIREGRHGVAGARSLGAAHATGEVLVFLDAHTVPRAGWLEVLVREIGCDGNRVLAPAVADARDPAAYGCGAKLVDRDLRYRWLLPANQEPYEIPIAPGGALVIARALYEDVGGFDRMRTYGVEDVEFSLRCWSYGIPCVGVPAAVVEHVFRSETPYPVDKADYVHNVLRCATVHFNEARLGRIVEHAATHPRFAPAAARLLASDVFTKREQVRSRRINDDEWFFRRFPTGV